MAAQGTSARRGCRSPNTRCLPVTGALERCAFRTAGSVCTTSYFRADQGAFPANAKDLKAVPGGSAHRRGAPASGRAGEPGRPHLRRRVGNARPAGGPRRRRPFGPPPRAAAVPGRGRRRMEPAPAVCAWDGVRRGPPGRRGVLISGVTGSLVSPWCSGGRRPATGNSGRRGRVR
jgi:hypothetical protein